jgi:hypothetical protein
MHPSVSLQTPWVRYAPNTPRDEIGVYELGHVTYANIRTVYIGS